MAKLIRAIKQKITARRQRRDVERAVAELDYKVYTVLQERGKKEKELDRLQSKLDKTESEHQDRVRKLKDSINEAKGIGRRMENILQTTKDELENLREIVIPGLVAANRTLTDARDAQSAGYAMRVAAMKLSGDSEEDM